MLEIIILSSLVLINFLFFSFKLKKKEEEIDDLRNNIDYLEENTRKVFVVITNGKIQDPDTPYDIVLQEIK